MQYSTLLFTTLIVLITPSLAQQAADGPLVPFTSVLPSCASQCGPLYDVQGGCSDNACFCADARLQSFNNQGTAGISQVCGATSCTSETDLQAVKTWYSGKCGGSSNATPTTSARTGANPTSRPSGSASTTPRPTGGASTAVGGTRSWVDTHKQWLIMAVILVIGIPALWVGAWFLRKRHLRKKEREIEMNPPATWGPHHAHGGNGLPPQESNVMSGGAGGHHKEMARDSTVPGRRLTKGKMGWFKPSN